MAFQKSHERLAVFVFGVVFIIVTLVIAMAFPSPTPFQYQVFRIVLALAAAGVAAFIPGFLQVEISSYLRAGGAIAVFVIIYFFSPAAVVTGLEQNAELRSRLVDMIDLALDEPPPYRESKPNISEIKNPVELLHPKDQKDELLLRLGKAIVEIYEERYDKAAELLSQGRVVEESAVTAAGQELPWRKIRADAWFEKTGWVFA